VSDVQQGGDSHPQSGQDGLQNAVQRRGSFLGTLKAVAWSFFGVRRARDFQQDTEQLNPIHIVIAGVLAAILFVLMLILLVNWVVSSGIAGKAVI
jgi:Protein of unknown function (DUF2970)